MSAKQIRAASVAAGLCIALGLLAAGQWNVWTWFGAIGRAAGSLWALEWERQRRQP